MRLTKRKKFSNYFKKNGWETLHQFIAADFVLWLDGKMAVIDKNQQQSTNPSDSVAPEVNCKASNDSKHVKRGKKSNSYKSVHRCFRHSSQRNKHWKY